MAGKRKRDSAPAKPRKKVKAVRKSPAAKTKRSSSKKRSKSVNPTLNNLVKLVGGGLGTFLGVGPTMGSSIADTAHRAFKDITGYGDYEINGNSLVTGQDSVPQFSNGGRHVRIKHREYIQDVITSATPGAFKLESFSLNPGLPQTYPWLYSVAQQFEEYIIRGMIFEFKTMSADALNSTNTALGSVIMASQYNVLNPDFANKQQMENYEFASSVKPSMNLIHPIECDPKDTPIGELYIRNQSTVITGSDLRLYDFAKFQIATTGMQAASVNIGELWVSYDIELVKPKMSLVSGFAGDSYYLTGNMSPSAPLYANQTKEPKSNFNTKILSATQIQMPSDYLGVVQITICKNNLTSETMTLTPSTGGVAYNLLFGGITNKAEADTATTGPYVATWFFKLNQPNVIITVASSATGTGNVGNLVINAVPNYNGV